MYLQPSSSKTRLRTVSNIKKKKNTYYAIHIIPIIILLFSILYQNLKQKYP